MRSQAFGLTGAAALLAAAAAGILLAAQPGAAGGTTIYAVDGPNLISFNSASPGAQESTVAIIGLQPAETILAIDFRPATGNLYGLGSTSRLYTITAKGEAALVGSGTFATPLAGTYFGFDFNPAADRIRVVSDTGQNLQLDPDTAVVTVDTDLAYAALDLHAGESPSVVALAYTNNFAGAGATTAFGIDSALDYAVRLGGFNGPPSPDAGTLFSFSSLGVDTTAAAGVDILGASTAYAMLTIGNTPRLYTVNALTGATTELGSIGAQFAIGDIAVPIPEATPTPSPSPTPAITPTPTSGPGTTTASPTPGASTPTPSPSPTPSGTLPRPLWGDVDCSGGVDSVDALKVLRHVAALSVSQTLPCPKMGEGIPLWGDVDCGGDVGSVDALKVLRYVAGLPVSQTQPCPGIGTRS